MNCDHKNIAKGTASPKLYAKVKTICLNLGMKQVLEEKLKSGKIKFRFESWEDINFQGVIQN